MSLFGWLIACGGGGIDNVAFELSPEIATVVNVTFETKDETTATVLFGPGDLRYETAPTASGTEHAVSLVGLRENTEAHFQIVTDADESKEYTIETGGVPNTFPPLTVEGEGHDRFAVVPMIGQINAAVILDPEGNYAWYHEDTSGLQVYRVRMLKDGSGVMYNAGDISGEPAENSALVKVSLDGTEVTETPVPLLAHDFVELDDGTIAAIVFEERDGVLGNAIVEIAPDGTQTPVWDSWMCFDPKVDVHEEMDQGWTFANALDYDEESDHYILGMHNFSSITAIDRATGACEWVFGDVASTITGAEFEHQHQFVLEGNHLTLFDNDGAPGDQSRVLEYELDFDAGTAERVWDFQVDGLYTFVLGDVQLLKEDERMVTWSASGQIDRVTATGESTWRVNTGVGFVFGFADHLIDAYHPDAYATE